MAWTNVKGNENTFEKTPVCGLVTEYFIRQPSDSSKVGLESLELKLDQVDRDTLQKTGKERTIFLSMGTKGWSNVGGAWVPPGYSEINGLFVLAGTQGVSSQIDIEEKDEAVEGVKIEIYDLKFEPDIIGAFIDIGVRESAGKGEGAGKFKNYTIQEFVLKGLPGGKSAGKTEKKAEQAQITTPRGRRTSAPQDPKSPDQIKTGYLGRTEFNKYMDFLTENSLTGVVTIQKIKNNIDEADIHDAGVKKWVADNVQKLIDECIEDGTLVESQADGAGKYRYVGKQEV